MGKIPVFSLHRTVEFIFIATYDASADFAGVSYLFSNNNRKRATLAEFLVGALRRRRLSVLLRAKAYYGLKWHGNDAFYAPYGTTRCYLIQQEHILPRLWSLGAKRRESCPLVLGAEECLVRIRFYCHRGHKVEKNTLRRGVTWGSPSREPKRFTSVVVARRGETRRDETNWVRATRNRRNRGRSRVT